MAGRASFRPLTQVVLGLLLVILGTALTIHLLGWADLRSFAPFWPASILALGLAELAPAKGRGRIWGLTLLALGAVFQLWTLGFLPVSPLRLWPLLLVALGLLVLWLAGRRNRGSPGEGLAELAVFSTFHRSFEDRPFSGGSLSLICAGGEVDLRRARMAGPEAVVDLVAIVGGATLKVPEGWVAVDELSGFFGGIENQAASGPPEAPRLIIRGTAILGGADVRR